VHFAGVLAGVGKGIELLHGQGVDVCPKAYTPAACTAITAVHNANHTRGAHAAVNGNAPVSELLGDHVGCALFFEAQLGVSVNVFANGRYAGRVCEDGVDDFHAYSLAIVVPLRYTPIALGGHFRLGLSPNSPPLEWENDQFSA
jgi:hypothetical protein